MIKLFCLLISLFSLPVLAKDILNDHRVIYSSETDFGEYRLALGALKKINGQWTADKETKLSGKISRRTIELNTGYTLVEAWQEVYDFISTQSATQLFVCDSYDCGRSNVWANNRFKIKQLYGQDASQKYSVWKYSNNQVNTVFVVYGVERGNKRIYLQLDRIDVEKLDVLPDESVLVKSLQEKGFIKLPEVQFIEDTISVEPQVVNLLANVMSNFRGREFLLVGHDFSAGTIDAQLERSTKFAKSAADLLVSAGVDESHLYVHGVGGLAPTSDLLTNKIILILKP